LAAKPARLSADAHAALDDEHSPLLLSHASVWEIYNKCSSGKLRLPCNPRRWVTEQLARRGVAEWPIDRLALDLMSELPLHHRDPFDRLLCAQALAHGLSVVSPDEVFDAYGVRRVW
jgi:PIN domain nuclease of toxin-antitoxin system